MAKKVSSLECFVAYIQVRMYNIILDTFILQNCSATSPSIGTIRVSCDSSHQILVTLTCTNNCSNPMVTSNGSSPLTVKGLDVGVMYNVTINVFNGSQVVLNDKLEVITITVMRNIPGKILYMYIRMHVLYVHTCMHACRDVRMCMNICVHLRIVL